MSPRGDPRFWVLREALSNYAGDPDDPEPRPGEVLQAAVSLILRGTDEMELLLIKRAKAEGDPWSGHMALPGGRRDGPDESLLETAIRETREEVDIELRGEGALHLGRLDEVAPRSKRLPSLSIHPFVFGVGAHTAGSPDPREVDALHWVPLKLLRSDEARDRIEVQFYNKARVFPCIRVAGEAVWGLTYGILSQFMDASPSELRR